MGHRSSVDEELSSVRTLRLRGEQGSDCSPSHSLAVLNVPSNGGGGLGDHHKIAELFIEALAAGAEKAAEALTPVAVIVVNRAGQQTNHAQVMFNSLSLSLSLSPSLPPSLCVRIPDPIPFPV